MIYEFRTYRLKPRSLGEFIKRFSEVLAYRLTFSRLAASWYTEIGPLNQVIHVWEYDRIDEHKKTRDAAVKTGVWPPDVSEFIIDMTSEILTPLPFSPPLTPTDYGPYFEIRTYTVLAGQTVEMAKRWEAHLHPRLTLSPLIGVFSSEVGKLNRWIHIWAYKSLDERVAIRKAAGEQGIWPPPGPSPVVDQETKILLPTPFSPIH